jgi:hypothetical protein
MTMPPVARARPLARPTPCVPYSLRSRRTISALSFGQQLGVAGVEPQLAAGPVGNAAFIAGDQQDALDAISAQPSDGLPGARPEPVANAEQPL